MCVCCNFLFLFSLAFVFAASQGHTESKEIISNVSRMQFILCSQSIEQSNWRETIDQVKRQEYLWTIILSLFQQ